MLTLVERPDPTALLRFAPATRAVVSWNSAARAGEIALDVHRTDGTVSAPLAYVRWSPRERRSLDGRDEPTRIAVDVVRSEVPFSGIGITANAALDAVAVATPPPPAPDRRPRHRVPTLDVPPLAQAVAGVPGSEARWCSPAALAMLLQFHGIACDVRTVAAAVDDASYGGTGNWSFNAAYAGTCGLRGTIAYLQNLDHAAAFVEAGFPVAISVAWNPGELPGAPLARSDGHLIILRGVEPHWALVNDPAHPDVATRYERDALDRVFRAHGGIAYLVGPRARTAELVALANAVAVAN